MNRHYHTLELEKILNMLKEETSIKEAGELALKLEPQYSLDKVEQLLTQTEDAHMLIGRFGAPSFGGIGNVTNPLRRAEAGGCLNTSELLSIARALRVIKGVRDWHAHCSGVSTTLDGYFRVLYTNPNLSDRITSCIIGADEISDGASRELSEIRRKMRIAASKAREVLDKIIHSSTYQKYLQEAIITQRDGRYVVPVKQEFRSQVAGLVHDTSSSGSTVFIEPMGVVNANNDIRVLKGEEEKEIERILFELSGLCAGCASDIVDSYHTLVELNLIFAKAHLAYKMKAVRPVMNDSGVIELKAARHPLIDKNKVVPTDIRLGGDFDTLVITGPNTGGKTVCLKTLGLLIKPDDFNKTLSKEQRDKTDHTWSVRYENLPYYVNTCSDDRYLGTASKVTYYIKEIVDEDTTYFYECADAQDTKVSEKVQLHQYGQETTTKYPADGTGQISVPKSAALDGVLTVILPSLPSENIYGDPYHYYVKQIGQERLAWLDSLPLEDELEISGIRFRLVHGRFLDPLYLSYDPDEKLREGFRFQDGRPDANGMICADSHRPFIRPLEGGYALNTGSVGNNLGMARAHALLLEGEKGPAPLRITILSVPYDNRKAAERADLYPDLPMKESYQREVLTGVYSR